jgi:hypothetical protein
VKVGRGTIVDRVIVLQYLQEQRPVTAVHEAGHAVAGLSLGWPVELIDLDAGGQRLGQTIFQGHGGRMDNDPPADAAMVDLAGLVAEWIAGGEHGPETIISWLLGRWVYDEDIFRARYKMWEARDQENAEDDRRFAEAAVSRAEAVLREHWADVERVAARLLDRGHLINADIELRDPGAEQGREIHRRLS